MRRAAYVLALLILVSLGAYLLVRTLLGSDVIRSTLEAQLSAKLRQPVRIGAASATLFPRVALDLRDVVIGSPPAVQLGTVRIVTGIRGLLSRTVADAQVIVMDSRIELPLPFPVLPTDGAPASSPPAEPAFTVTSVRLFSLRNVAVGAAGREVLLDLDSAIAGDRLRITRLTMRADTTTLEATGELTSIERMQGRLDARTDLLDIAEAVAIASAFTVPGPAVGSAARRSEPGTLRMEVRLVATSGRFAAYEFRDLSSTLVIVPGRVLLDPVSVGIFGGTAQGRLEVDSSRAAPQVRLNGRFAEIDVAELIEREGGGAGVTGRAEGTVSIETSGSDAHAMTRAARGSVAAVVTNGTIPGMDLVRAVVLAFGRPSGAPPEGSGTSFSRLGGTFALAGGSVRSNDLVLESRDFDMAGRAGVNLITGAVEAAGNVVLSPELTAQAGTDLRRYAGEDGRVVVPATISGTLDRARISLDIAAAAKRALGNELRRRTKSLLDDLFRRLDGR